MKKSCDCDYRNIDKYTMKFAELAKFLDSRINTYNHDNMYTALSVQHWVSTCYQVNDTNYSLYMSMTRTILGTNQI